MINTEKMNVPHGILKEVARRCKTTTTSVGHCFFRYESGKIGVSKTKKELILNTAVELAKEKRDELDSFIAAVESANIDPSVSAVK